MFKELLNQMGVMGVMWTVGLVMMVGVFLLILLYALTCSREQSHRWANIPLNVDENPGTQPRTRHHD